ncbi:unnamed protein product, partial [Fusarium graminearum]
SRFGCFFQILIRRLTKGVVSALSLLNALSSVLRAGEYRFLSCMLSSRAFLTLAIPQRGC